MWTTMFLEDNVCDFKTKIEKKKIWVKNFLSSHVSDSVKGGSEGQGRVFGVMGQLDQPQNGFQVLGMEKV